MSILNLFNLEGEVAVVTGAGKGNRKRNCISTR